MMEPVRNAGFSREAPGDDGAALQKGNVISSCNGRLWPASASGSQRQPQSSRPAGRSLVAEGASSRIRDALAESDALGSLTDDDLDVVEGKRDQLAGRLQERYGYAKDQASREIDAWLSRQ